MYEFWYDYVKSKCTEKAKLCCMGTDSFIDYKKTFTQVFKKIMKKDLILQIMTKRQK